MDTRKTVSTLLALLGLALAGPAEVLVDDFTAGERIRLGYDLTEYGYPLQPWDVPVPVGSTVTVTTTGPGLLGGSRDMTLHKIAGWNDTPYLAYSPSVGRLSYNTFFDDQSEWWLVYGGQDDLDLDLSACSSMGAIEITVSGQLDYWGTGTPLQVTAISGSGAASATTGVVMVGYLLDPNVLTYSFPFGDFPGVDFSDLDRLEFRFEQNASNPAVDFSVRNIRISACETRTSGTDDRPAAFRLADAWPNPFNPTTTLSFTLAETAMAKLTVHDLAGRTVATLVDGLTGAGSHQVAFDAAGLPSGVYIYTLSSGSFSESRKLILLK